VVLLAAVAHKVDLQAAAHRAAVRLGRWAARAARRVVRPAVLVAPPAARTARKGAARKAAVVMAVAAVR
jgi:hypothetical protein